MRDNPFPIRIRMVTLRALDLVSTANKSWDTLRHTTHCCRRTELDGIIYCFTLSTRAHTRTRHAPRAQPGAHGRRTLSLHSTRTADSPALGDEEGPKIGPSSSRNNKKNKTRAGAGGPQNPAHTRPRLSIRGLGRVPSRAGSRACFVQAAQQLRTASCHAIPRGAVPSPSVFFLRVSFWLF